MQAAGGGLNPYLRSILCRPLEQAICTIENADSRDAAALGNDRQTSNPAFDPTTVATFSFSKKRDRREPTDKS